MAGSDTGGEVLTYCCRYWAALNQLPDIAATDQTAVNQSEEDFEHAKLCRKSSVYNLPQGD